MMIGETASCNKYDRADVGSDQADFITSLGTNLKLSTYSEIRAVLYFDAYGNYSPGGSACPWILDATPMAGDPISGLQALTTLGNDTFFSNTVVPH